MNLPTKDQLNAMGRHVGSSLGGAMAMLAFLHITTADDANKAVAALNQIGHGLSEIMAAIGVLMPIAMGVIAYISANPLMQLLKGSKAVAADPSLAKDATIIQQATIATAASEMPEVKVVAASKAVADVAGVAVVPTEKVEVKL